MSVKERATQKHQTPKYFFLESAAAFVRRAKRLGGGFNFPMRLRDQPFSGLPRNTRGAPVRLDYIPGRLFYFATLPT